VPELTEPQSWVLIGVFASAILGMMTSQTVLLNRTIDTSIRRVEAKLDAKFEVVETKLTHLDRDVQALTRHVFGADRD
jgi:hypothetical protein